MKTDCYYSRVPKQLKKFSHEIKKKISKKYVGKIKTSSLEMRLWYNRLKYYFNPKTWAYEIELIDINQSYCYHSICDSMTCEAPTRGD